MVVTLSNPPRKRLNQGLNTVRSYLGRKKDDGSRLHLEQGGYRRNDEIS